MNAVSLWRAPRAGTSRPRVRRSAAPFAMAGDG